LDQASPNTAQATDTSLKVRSSRTLILISQNRRGLVRFTLPAMDADCEIKSATLRLTATSSDSGRTLNALRIAGAWDATATWNKQPTTTGTAVTAPSGNPVEWDVKAQVAAMYTGANNGWLIQDANENEPDLLGFGGPE
jgi:hypothetical protein